MEENTFRCLVSKVPKFISKEDTHMRNCINVEDQLMVTLGFLAAGELYSSLQYSSRVPQCSLSIIISGICKATFESMKGKSIEIRSYFY